MGQIKKNTGTPASRAKEVVYEKKAYVRNGKINAPNVFYVVYMYIRIYGIFGYVNGAIRNSSMACFVIIYNTASYFTATSLTRENA